MFLFTFTFYLRTVLYAWYPDAPDSRSNIIVDLFLIDSYFVGWALGQGPLTSQLKSRHKALS